MLNTILKYNIHGRTKNKQRLHNVQLIYVINYNHIQFDTKIFYFVMFA